MSQVPEFWISSIEMEGKSLAVLPKVLQWKGLKYKNRYSVIDLDDQIILIFNQQALSLMAIIGRLALP